MDLNDLALFAHVVERGSFTAAAKAMALPKSSVTRGIARLERTLGVRLIQRTTRQRGITDAGRELYERVRGAVAALEEASDAVRTHGRAPAGVVRVTAPSDSWTMGLPEALAELRTRWPQIHVELIVTTRIVDLVAEGVDLAIRAGKLADSSLIATRVGASNAALFASKAYVGKHGPPSKLADLADHACILFRGHQGRGTWSLQGPRGGQTIAITGVASTDDYWISAKLVAEDVGIGLLPMFIAHRHGGLERVLPTYVMPGEPIHVVMPSGSYVPARVTAVRDQLVAYLSRRLKVCERAVGS
ncbi:MAG: LysR family transcriptional regulator [Proteobacteria bacterium]|nr:LysR family transcriptional regulator [Pseudomonadota bacterium]